MAREAEWEGIRSAFEDPEEAAVISRAFDSFAQYERTAHWKATHARRQAFYSLPREQWQVLAGPPFNYLQTLERVDEAIDSNGDLARAIIKASLPAFVPAKPEGAEGADKEIEMPLKWVKTAKPQDIDKARCTIRQFFRDWSAGGEAERKLCYGPVMQALCNEKANKPTGQDSPLLKVLVPGAGLGRLVFDLTANGFDAEGNEISYHQLLGSSYILNMCEREGQHTIYPWIHSFSNHKTRENHLRGYQVPDVHPATRLAEAQKLGRVGTMSMVAADFLCLYSDKAHKDTYDAVAAVFFLDTAPNILRYLETIFHCLKPGGILVNFGPLLWHFEDDAPSKHNTDDEGNSGRLGTETNGIADPGSYELTDEEVMELVGRVGFMVESRETGLEAPYIRDTESMMQSVYKASTWVARKPESRSRKPSAFDL
ncbi:N2227-like protein-domain-containing protein [Podospora didyma]|uniref:carnosine N-methyltransferase n=1 Tax=Podospora didyma TaxID=330526 RepID=A0AAE0K4W0_9PEZI|nr:N2227-like protein-domain-containing protein [Podospora didyma]